MKNLLLIILLLGILGCSESSIIDDEPDRLDIDGYYQVSSIDSNISLDINKDGKSSKNIYQELDSPHYFNSGRDSSDQIEWNNPEFMLHISPGGIDDFKHFIAFNFPEPYMSTENDGTPFVLDYLPRMITYYANSKDDLGNLQLENANPDFEENGIPISFRQVRLESFILTMSTKFYDHETSDWVNVELEVLYRKVDLP